VCDDLLENVQLTGQAFRFFTTSRGHVLFTTALEATVTYGLQWKKADNPRKGLILCLTTTSALNSFVRIIDIYSIV